MREFQDLQRRVQQLEARPTNPVPSYATGNLPPAASVPNLLVRNTTTGTLQWSDGTNWINS